MKFSSSIPLLSAKDCVDQPLCFNMLGHRMNSKFHANRYLTPLIAPRDRSVRKAIGELAGMMEPEKAINIWEACLAAPAWGRENWFGFMGFCCRKTCCFERDGYAP